MRFQTLIAIVLVTVSAVLWIARHEVTEAVASLRTSNPSERANNGRRASAVPVIVAEVDIQTNTATVSAFGTARAQRAVMLAAKTEGEIKRIDVRSGDRVTKGQELFALDPEEAQLALEIAKRKLEDAERALERNQQLRHRGVNSAATVEDANSLHRQALLALAQAERALRNVTVVAPFSGIVGIMKLEAGDRVTAGTHIVSLDDRSQLIVEFPVPERYIPRLKKGGELTVRTPSYRDRTFTGTIETIDSRIDARSRSVMVRASISNAEDELRPGMSFAIEIQLPGKQFPSIPELALQWRAGSSYVWVIKDQLAQQVRVSLVRRQNQTILVSGTLSAGDLVVVEGVQRLRPGRRVTFERPQNDARPKPVVTGANHNPVPGNPQRSAVRDR